MFEVSDNLICASLFTGNFDVNRNETLAPDNFQIIEKWCSSIQNLGLKGLVFHNNYSEKTISEVQNKHIRFIKVEFNTKLNANVYRYLVYLNFLKKHENYIQNIFFTDIADVEVVKNPFTDPLFTQNPNSLFCGDEEEIFDNPWMRDHCNHLRNLISGFGEFEDRNRIETLLNCGVIGGEMNVILPLIEELATIHSKYTISNQTPFTLDMGAFNFVARTRFSDRLKHGYPINSRFKGYETQRTDCWFRHK